VRDASLKDFLRGEDCWSCRLVALRGSSSAIELS
jgi:hypothetical protein